MSEEDYSKFVGFPKVRRFFRDIIITEKIDGTNAQVVVDNEGRVRAGSRNRFLTTEKDNYGFCKWVMENEPELAKLGPGRHYGEWWGRGIQRGYGLDHRRFSLFNTTRWKDEHPECCHVVPVLYEGHMRQEAIAEAIDDLVSFGSQAVPHDFESEGIMIYHCHSNQIFKVTTGGDGHKHGKE